MEEALLVMEISMLLNQCTHRMFQIGAVNTIFDPCSDLGLEEKTVQTSRYVNTDIPPTRSSADGDTGWRLEPQPADWTLILSGRLLSRFVIGLMI